MQAKIRHYVTGVTIAGTVLFGALYLIEPGIQAGYLLAAVVFFVFALMASSMSLSSFGEHDRIHRVPSNTRGACPRPALGRGPWRNRISTRCGTD